MATVGIIRPAPVPPPPAEVVLKMSEEDAEFLFSTLMAVHGDAGRDTLPVYRALLLAGIRRSTHYDSVQINRF